MKRTILALCALVAASAIPASANYLLLAPTGTTLSTAQVRAEAAISPGRDNGQYYWLATGLMQIEVNLIQRNPDAGKKETRLGAQWSFLPETSLTPAIGFGVTDIASESDEGIAGYLAVTKSLPVGWLNTFVRDLSVTAGVGAGGINGIFGGVELKLPMGLFAQAEYDSRDFNGAVGWQPVSMFRVKAYSLRDDFYVGAELLPIRF